MNTNIGMLAWTTALLALAAPDASLAPAPDEIRAAPAASSAPPAMSTPVAATRGSRPEVWLCAGDRIAQLLRPDAEWSFVKQHLNGIKLYVASRSTGQHTRGSGQGGGNSHRAS